MNLFELIYIVKYLWNILTKRRKFQIVLLIIFNVFSSFVEIISIATIMPFISAISDPTNFYKSIIYKKITTILIVNSSKFLFYITVLFVMINLFSGIIRLIASYLNTRISFIAGSDIGQELFKKTILQNYEFHTQTNSSNLISIISSKAGTIITNAVSPSINLINSIFLFVIMFASLLYINIKITLILIIFLGAVYYVIILFIKPIIKKESIVTSKKTDETIRILQESFGGIREILLYNSLQYQIEKYTQTERKLRDSQSKSGVISSFPKFIIEPIGMVLLALIAYNLFKENSKIGDSLSLLVVITVALQRLLPVVQQIFTNWSSIANSKSSIEDVINLFKLESTSVEQKQKIYWEREIQVKDVYFKYETRPEFIFKNVNLSINKGEIIGIIGKSGVGKSTFIDILCGLLVPTNGSIIIDDFKITTDQDLSKWRNSVAVVSQRIFLTDSTLKENIAFGIPLENIDLVKLDKAINIANLVSTINHLPNGIDTILGERGIQISGGQLQRIGIARAFYKDATVLILDEFTSSLDSKTEDEILHSINIIRNNFTIIVVSHKSSNLSICDSIYEVKDSNIIKIK
jgi:ATP-binding cassette subfamily B protein